MTAFSLISQLTDEYKSLLISEFVRIENTEGPLDVKSVRHSTPYLHAEYETPDTKGCIPIVITPDDIGSEMMLIKSVGESVLIVVNSDYFVEHGITVDFYACVAHEIGHYLSGHLNKVEWSLPNLYKKENLRLCEAGAQEEHCRLSVKAILEGGYLEKEFEADLVAAKFLGIANVVTMQISSAGRVNNPIVALDKINRAVLLSKTRVPHDSGYVLRLC